VFNSYTRPSTTRAVVISVPSCNGVMELHRNGKLIVNGAVTSTLPASIGSCISVVKSGTDMLATLPIYDVSLLWDGNTLVQLKVPLVYRDHICGLCDIIGAASSASGSGGSLALTSAGGVVMSNLTVFSESWTVPSVDAFGVPCSDATMVPDPLTTFPSRLNLSNNYCSNSISNPTGRYINCLPLVNPAPFVSACAYKVAACNKIICGCFAVKAYECACRDAGAAFIYAIDKCWVCGGATAHPAPL